jgi:DNA-binding FadR family transcriptional regulator
LRESRPRRDENREEAHQRLCSLFDRISYTIMQSTDLSTICFILASRRGIDMTSTREPAASVVRFAPMHDQILPHLRRDIVENRWKSGERLSEPLLCKQFDVSRTPLRQALKTLEAEGLVRLVPHVGAVVTDPGATEIRETMEILIGLEQLAAIRVAQSRPPLVLQEIRRIFREMKQAARRGEASRYYELNNDFHLSIVREPATNRWPTCTRKSCGMFIASGTAPTSSNRSRSRARKATTKSCTQSSSIGPRMPDARCAGISRVSAA